MHGELVALDLETTGLDYMRDAIIEVGAVRLREGAIIAEYSTYVNPKTPIPPNITHITGIQSQDVAGAPTIEQVLPQIVEFVGNAPLIAHNISLDMGFLRQRHKVLLNTLGIDTYDLATVLLPRAARYNLNSLTSELGIALEHAHRALDDARATALLYWQLWQKALELPRVVLEEIVNLTGNLTWESGEVFRAALHHTADARRAYQPVALMTPAPQEKPLEPAEKAQAVSAEAIAQLLGEGGAFSRQLPGYEHRPQQLAMAQAVAEAFNGAYHLMVEAGTGTGKSLAYLVPSVLWATANQRPVVISTNTINLQEQLLTKDIPLLNDALGVDFRATVLKGRANYLCPTRLEAVRRRRPTSVMELRTLAKILVWLLESPTAERGELSLRGPVEGVVWQRLSAQDEDCTPTRCLAVNGGRCPFFKARKAAESAHVIITNHALLVSDAVAGSRVLPQYTHAVIDEAHHLEEAITNGLTFEAEHTALLRRIADLGGPNRGLLGELLKNFGAVATEKELARLESFVQTVDEVTRQMGALIKAFFESLQAFLRDIHSGTGSEYVSMVRIVRDHRQRASFGTVQDRWKALAEYLEVVSTSMKRLTEGLKKFEDRGIPRYSEFLHSVDTAANFLSDVYDQIDGFVRRPDDSLVYWLVAEQGAEALPRLNSAPLHIGALTERHLWHDKQSVVMTSATLRTGDNFNYLIERLNADGIATVEVGSPFDYSQSTLLYLPRDMPEPNDRGNYQRAVERAIIELAAALNGRTLVLFTSYSHLRQTAQAVAPRLALGGISVYDQSDGSSRQALVEGFASQEKAVLMGTRSFWEGVDIPGEALSALIITRLPFAVPTDPIFSARAEMYDNAFEEFTVPDAILRFRQGFGRLIRRRTDRGVVLVLDRRIISKGYGSTFLESLPDCTVEYGRLDGIAEAATRWLKR